MDNLLPNFKELTKEEGTIYGRHNTVTSVNPYECRFIAYYHGGIVIRGNNLFQTGWDDIPHGLVKLEYVLSTGHVVEIPKYIAYMPMIECSNGVDGSRVFHSINVQCLAEKEVITYKIILKQDLIEKFKIGDVIMSKSPKPDIMSSSWKYTS